jgi:hypothetical protein
VDPIPDPLLLRKSGSGGNRNRDLWICNQELWPLDHRGGPIYMKQDIIMELSSKLYRIQKSVKSTISISRKARQTDYVAFIGQKRSTHNAQAEKQERKNH